MWSVKSKWEKKTLLRCDTLTLKSNKNQHRLPFLSFAVIFDHFKNGMLQFCITRMGRGNILHMENEPWPLVPKFISTHSNCKLRRIHWWWFKVNENAWNAIAIPYHTLLCYVKNKCNRNNFHMNWFACSPVSFHSLHCLTLLIFVYIFWFISICFFFLLGFFVFQFVPLYNNVVEQPTGHLKKMYEYVCFWF